MILNAVILAVVAMTGDLIFLGITLALVGER